MRFRIIGEPSYPGQIFEFSYADMNPEPFEMIPPVEGAEEGEETADQMMERRPDLVMLGRNM